MLLILFLLLAFAQSARADKYDPQNYPPYIDTITIDNTNLPVVYIDTRCGDTVTHAIHRDYRIAAHMKITLPPSTATVSGGSAAETTDYDGWIAIRYRGFTSFKYSPKKPYNFKTMKTSDPDGEKLKTELLGMPKDNTWVLIAPYDDSSLLRDVLMFQLARPYFNYTPRCRYCELVVDGIYYGIYILAENIRKGKNRLDLDDPGTSGDELTGGYLLQVDRDDEPHFTSKYLAVDSIGNTYKANNKIYLQYKHPDYEDLLPEQDNYIQQMFNKMEDALASPDFADPETGYRQYLDPLSFIDQQLSQEFSGNADGYRLSTNIYKKRDSQDPRFKTTIWDFNVAFGNSGVANAKGTDFWRYQNSYLTSYSATNKVPFWWMRLMEDTAYVHQLKARWAEYRTGNYSQQYIMATIDSITTLLEKDGALIRNNIAWQMPGDYYGEINRIKQWICDRIAWMDNQLEYNPTAITGSLPSGRFGGGARYYALNGTPLKHPLKTGITIVILPDGTTRLSTPRTPRTSHLSPLTP